MTALVLLQLESNPMVRLNIDNPSAHDASTQLIFEILMAGGGENLLEASKICREYGISTMGIQTYFTYLVLSHLLFLTQRPQNTFGRRQFY